MTEALVILGGGVAGAVAAAVAARAGRRPLVIERSRGPHHKVCGEFLSWEGADALRAAGFEPLALAPARIDRVRLILGRRAAEAALPRAGLGLSRFALDEALLAHAAACGARIERGVAARRVTAEGGALTVEAEGARIRADAVLLATGKTAFRDLPRRLSAQVTDDLVGFKGHFRLTARQSAALGSAVELHLLRDGGYAGLQPIEDGRATLCALLPRAALPERPGRWDGLLTALAAEAPVLGDRLDAAEALFARPLTIAGVPYGWLHRQAAGDPPGLARLGDQLAVIHSFTGDGMAIAAATGIMAATLPPGAFAAAALARVGPAVRRSALLHAALRSPTLRAATVRLARVAPGALTAAARLTRAGA